MTRIVRCPACGALWKCPDEAAETLRCGECRHTFVLARAETVEVDDDALARVVAARRAPEEKKEAQMAKIAEDLSDFHARETPEPAVPVRAAPPEKKPRKGGALFALLGLVGLAGALTAGALYFHDPILRQFPPLRGVYENICRTLPCPGFAWSDVRAFEIRGELTEAESPRRVRIEITNGSGFEVEGSRFRISITPVRLYARCCVFPGYKLDFATKYWFFRFTPNCAWSSMREVR